jgi:lipopolysaccharide transport system permease protein
MLELARGVWRFRGFIVASAKREFATRYRGTQLGILWPVVHPLSLVVIYTLIFSEVMKSRLAGHDSPFAYSIYLTAGFIAWALFSDLLGRSTGIFVQNATLLKKVNVHKLALPAIAAIGALINAGILLACFLAFLAVSGEMPGAPLAAVVPVLAVTTLFAMSLGLVLATVNVFYRDVEHTILLVLQFWFWVTPIVYPVAALPQWLADALRWNPMWPLARAMQDIFVENRFPDWASLAYPLVISIALVFLARAIFERLAAELVDEL